MYRMGEERMRMLSEGSHQSRKGGRLLASLAVLQIVADIINTV